MKMLNAYNWPGNVRELKNILERAVLLARGGELKPAHFIGLSAERVINTSANGEVMNLEAMEGIHIKSVMDSFNGDARQAAEALGVSLATLYRKLKKITPPQ